MVVSASKIDALGRANKTEAIQLRVDPKRRFVLEMVARRFGKPLSSVLEDVLDDWLTTKQPTILKGAESAWTPFVSKRFILQAQTFPDTLTDMENILWGLTRWDDRFWFGETTRPRPKATEANFDFALLEKEWDELCKQTLANKELQEMREDLREQMRGKKKGN